MYLYSDVLVGKTISDLKKMALTKHAYQNYKKIGWKASFIKYKEE